MAITEAKKKNLPNYAHVVLFPCFLIGPKDITDENQRPQGSLAPVAQDVRAKNESISDDDMAVSLRRRRLSKRHSRSSH